MIFNQINAQETKKSYLGFQIGGTHSKIVDDKELNFLIQSNWKTNFSMGISYRYLLNQTISFEARLNYLNIGTSYDDIPGDLLNDGGEVDFTTDLQYINMPITVFVSPFKSPYFHFLGGFYASKLISAKQNGNLDGYVVDIGNIFIDRDLYKSTNSLDFGLVTGIGSRININNKINFGIDLRYNYGFTNLNKSYTNDNNTYQNNFYSFDIGLEFLLE